MKIFLSICLSILFFSCKQHVRTSYTGVEPKPTKEQKQAIADFITQRIQKIDSILIDSPYHPTLPHLRKVLVHQRSEMLAKN
jgi:hypothetical protein